jgi:uncharacterized protein YecE (DUF72 family)
MQFGKVPYDASFNYNLPLDHKSVPKVFGGKRTAAPRVFTGGSLWSDEAFKGSIYPANAKTSDYLAYYTKQFNTIELNATHYRIPDEAGLLHWRNTAPEGFVFCPKINKTISHAFDLLPQIDYHNACMQAFDLLGNKLGVCFMQLPPQFSPQRLSELLAFLDQSTTASLAIELRHYDWFTDQASLNTLCNYLYKHDMPLVITDTPGRRDVLHMRLTNRTAFVRYNSHNNDSPDMQRITEWVHRAKTWFDLGLETFYFFVHTSNQARMPLLVSYFIDQLEKTCGIRLAAPVIKDQDAEEPWFSGA